jgi:hypothetical protein
MSRFAIVCFFAAAAFAQNPDNPFERPPAKVDKALRERIHQFYTFHMNKEFRKAEALVADDTKEFFYSANKPAYLSFEISNIQYSDNFKRAKATVICEQYVMVPGFADKPVKIPTPSTWKLVKGKWYWYVDREVMRTTPFGKMTPGKGPARGPIPAVIPTSPDAFLKQVRADKESVRLKAGQPEQVTITNFAPGPMDISVFGAIAGVEAKIDQANLKIGGKAVLTLIANRRVENGLLTIRVEQTGELIPIRVDAQ